MIAVIPAKAEIRKRERSFVTLHSASWVRGYSIKPSFLYEAL